MPILAFAEDEAVSCVIVLVPQRERASHSPHPRSLSIPMHAWGFGKRAVLVFPFIPSLSPKECSLGALYIMHANGAENRCQSCLQRLLDDLILLAISGRRAIS